MHRAPESKMYEQIQSVIETRFPLMLFHLDEGDERGAGGDEREGRADDHDGRGARLRRRLCLRAGAGRGRAGLGRAGDLASSARPGGAGRGHGRAGGQVRAGGRGGDEVGEERARRGLDAVARRDARRLVRDRRDRAERLVRLRVRLRGAGRVRVDTRDTHVVRVADLEVTRLEAGADGVLRRAVVAETDAVERVLAVAGLVAARGVADLQAEHVRADEATRYQRALNIDEGRQRTKSTS
jgi:hypothetical protein